MSKITINSPISNKKNKKTFITIISILTCLMYFAIISSNGIRNFINFWNSDPDQECYIILPYAGSSKKLEENLHKIEDYLKGSAFVKNFQIVDYKEIKKTISEPLEQNEKWSDSLPMPILIEIKLKSVSEKVFQKIEKDLYEITEEAKLQTQLRYSKEFTNSLNILLNLVNGISIAISITIFLVIALMIKALFAQQEKNVEKLSMLGATPDYISRLYCWLVSKNIALSIFYGFLSATIIIITLCTLTKNTDFFTYGFNLYSCLVYLAMPLPCLIIAFCITYLIVYKMQKKLFKCA